MTYPQDDNEALWVPPNVENPPRYAIGVLEEWNNETFTNAVRYRGAVLRNLAVINGLEALGFAPGIQVSLLGHSGTGALTSFAILGRYVQPGATATAEAIQGLQSTVAKELVNEIVEGLLTSPAGQDLAAFVFAQRIYADTVDTSETRTSLAYGDLATVGPTVSGVRITDSGRALVFLAASTRAQAPLGAGSGGGFMSVDVSGATSIPPAVGDIDAFALNATNSTGAGTPHSISIRAGSTRVIDGLNPGVHTFQAKYRAYSLDTSVTFSSRALVVIAF